MKFLEEVITVPSMASEYNPINTIPSVQIPHIAKIEEYTWPESSDRYLDTYLHAFLNLSLYQRFYMNDNGMFTNGMYKLAAVPLNSIGSGSLMRAMSL